MNEIGDPKLYLRDLEPLSDGKRMAEHEITATPTPGAATPPRRNQQTARRSASWTK